MEPELQKYYEELLDLFLHPGWKQFQQDFNESFEMLESNARATCKTNDQWQYRRGELDQLAKIIKFEDFIREGYESVKDAAI